MREGLRGMPKGAKREERGRVSRQRLGCNVGTHACMHARMLMNVGLAANGEGGRQRDG